MQKDLGANSKPQDVLNQVKKYKAWLDSYRNKYLLLATTLQELFRITKDPTRNDKLVDIQKIIDDMHKENSPKNIPHFIKDLHHIFSQSSDLRFKITITNGNFKIHMDEKSFQHSNPLAHIKNPIDVSEQGVIPALQQISLLAQPSLALVLMQIGVFGDYFTPQPAQVSADSVLSKKAKK